MRLSAPIYQLRRRARLLARNEKIPLHEALDRIARDEGFGAWSLLSVQWATSSKAILSRLRDGDMLLLGARPGHGKTMLGLQLLLDAAREGRRSVFFTLEYTEQEARAHIQSVDDGDHRLADRLEIVTSDDISADFIVRHLFGSPRGTLAVVDYLQVLDQQRSKPALRDQMIVLKEFAHRAETILGFISQIGRTFDSEASRWPGIQDIRLPNPIDPGIFSKACFLHKREVRFQDVA
jgi:replicative DNA helicase